MRILFATVAPLRQGAAGPTSDLASARYRVLIPAQSLARMGHQVQLASLGPGGWPQQVKDAPCDVLVISKSFHAANEDLAKAMRARGVKVVVDLCDDHFESPEFGGHFRNLVALADTVVASTDAMAEAVKRHTGRDSIVITDPVEGPRGFPKFAPKLPWLRVAWFGHPSNLDGIAAKAAELTALAGHVPVHLSIVTAAWPQTPPFIAQLAGANPAKLRLELVPWSMDATWKTLAEADLTWIPVAESTRTAVKSPNRLLESLWAGRMVVADPVPSYTPFADLVPLGKGLMAGALRGLEDAAAPAGPAPAAQRALAALPSPSQRRRQRGR